MVWVPWVPIQHSRVLDLASLCVRQSRSAHFLPTSPPPSPPYFQRHGPLKSGPAPSSRVLGLGPSLGNRYWSSSGAVLRASSAMDLIITQELARARNQQGGSHPSFADGNPLTPVEWHRSPPVTLCGGYSC